MSTRSKVPKQLKDKLWKVFSAYIKKRDDYTCITCGKKGTGAGIHSGHFIPDHKGGETIRYNEYNVHAQCYYCNINLGGWGERYCQRMEERYGKNKIVELRAVVKEIEAFGKKAPLVEFDYEAMLGIYASKLAELERKEALTELTQLSQEMGLYD